MTNETYPGQHEVNRAHDDYLDAHGPALYTPAEIAGRRHRLGLTRAALGKRLGVSERAVARWEDGERTMLTEHADALTDLLEQSDREVARGIRRIEATTPEDRILVTYRNDAHMREHFENADDPQFAGQAGWSRAIADRIEMGASVNVRTVYAP